MRRLQHLGQYAHMKARYCQNMRHPQAAEGLAFLLVQQALFAQKHGGSVGAVLLTHDGAQALGQVLPYPRHQARQVKGARFRRPVLHAVDAKGHAALVQVRPEVEPAGILLLAAVVHLPGKGHPVPGGYPRQLLPVKAPVGLTGHGHAGPGQCP